MRVAQCRGSEITAPEDYRDDEQHFEQYKQGRYPFGAVVKQTTELNCLGQRWWVWMLQFSYRKPGASHQ